MFFFYLVFPSMLPQMQRMSTQYRAGLCMGLFWLQLMVYWLLFYGADTPLRSPC
eukprot:SAG31_NODE_2366_length_5859_cov_4.794097_6_plen_54_part_00